MKYEKICRLSASSIILALLLLLSATPSYAADGFIALVPGEGEIGDYVEINGSGFDANEVVCIYFSSDKAGEGDTIDKKVTAYKKLMWASTNADGDFISSHEFYVPDELTDGKHEEDVHGGDYYVYAACSDGKQIEAMAKFTVIDGEIELDPEEGTVGSEVEISGEGLRHNQKITAEYDGDEVDIISEDNVTDNAGQFTCAIIIPESTMGDHVITVIDESGNRPEAEFSVEPKITLDPTEQVAGREVIVNGAGFNKREVITITLDGCKTPTMPMLLYADYQGSFSGSFLAPLRESHTTVKVEAGEEAAFDYLTDQAEALLTILTGIHLDPVTSPTSPGYVGTELTVYGAGFIANATVTITYSINGETTPVATATTNVNGNFTASFTVPPAVAGSHAITATDGTSTLTSTFTMESQVPPMPVLLLPGVADTAGAEAYFDWEDVIDPSGVSYVFQVASDADFTTIVLEKEGLPGSEYTVTKEEKLEPTGKEAPYYWRVKAVDGASNESEWTLPGLFYIGFSRTSMPDWIWYIFYGLGVSLLVFVGLRVRKARK